MHSELVTGCALQPNSLSIVSRGQSPESDIFILEKGDQRDLQTFMPTGKQTNKHRKNNCNIKYIQSDKYKELGGGL